MAQLSLTAGAFVRELEAPGVNDEALIEAGGAAAALNGLWQPGAASLRAPRQLLVGVTRPNSTAARSVFATPSAHIPVLLAEDTAHSRRSNKNLTQLLGCARTEPIQKHGVCAGSAGGACRSVPTAGRAPRAAPPRVTGVLRSCRGSSWGAKILFSFTTRAGSQMPNYFSPTDPKCHFLNFPSPVPTLF